MSKIIREPSLINYQELFVCTGCAAYHADCDHLGVHHCHHDHRHPLRLLLRPQADGGGQSSRGCM